MYSYNSNDLESNQQEIITIPYHITLLCSGYVLFILDASNDTNYKAEENDFSLQKKKNITTKEVKLGI